MNVNEIDLRLSKDEAERNEVLDNRGKFDFQAFFQKNQWQVLAGCLGILLLGVGALSTVALSSKNEASEIEIISAEEEQASEIYVHVAGAVQKPGLYKLSSSARVNDALSAAGGLSAEADREWFNQSINLAQKLQDGVKLYIPYGNEAGKVDSAPGAKITNAPGASNLILGQQIQGMVNINTATVDQLDSLPGIGPAYAQRIIDARPFQAIEDLLNVSGIGEKTFSNIKDLITVY